MAIFKGAGVAIATPFYADGSVNYDEFGRLIEFQIANGTDAIIVCGTTGESATLSEEEHVDVIKYCIDKVAKRIPVIAGTGSNSTETAIMLSQEAEKAGEHIPPFLISSITSGCTLHCAGCYSRSNGATNDCGPKDQLSAAEWRKIFDEARDLGVSFILLAGYLLCSDT